MSVNVRDYGGYSGGRSFERRKSTTLSMRCLDCSTLRYVFPRELSRAASPRCTACGGPLEEIVVSRKRRGVADGASKKPKVAARRCPGCGECVHTNAGLWAHLGSNPECIEYHSRESLLTDSGIIAGSVHVSKATTAPTTKPWEVLAARPTGLVSLRRFSTKYAAQDWIKDEFGPVKFAGPLGEVCCG